MSLLELPDDLNSLTYRINRIAIDVQRELGVGLLEKANEAILADELRHQGLQVLQQVPVPVVFRGRLIPKAFRLDMLVEERVVIELKSVAKILPVHRAQLLTYLRLTGKPVGLVLNFGEIPLGKRRVVHDDLLSAPSVDSASPRAAAQAHEE